MGVLLLRSRERIRMNWRWFFAVVLLTTLFMLVQLPTRFILPLLPNISNVVLLEPIGTVWKGGVSVSTQMLPEKAYINWNWQASQVFSGSLLWDVTAHTGEVQSSLVLNIGKAAWQANGSLTVPEGHAIPQWANWLPIGKNLSEKKVDFSGVW
jgi:hypothetical protein